MASPKTSINTISVAKDTTVFYRSAGPLDAPILLLLHGYPSSSHQFRHLIPLLATKYRVIAPDLPGFGFTTVPSDFKYTFDNLASVVDQFLSTLNITKFSMYVFDYGAPTGWRLALKHPEAITSIISQNGSAYKISLGKEFWAPLQKYWASGAQSDRDALKPFFNLENTKWQYTVGVSNPEVIEPESYWLDYALLTRQGVEEAQLDLFYDYRTNLEQYPKLHEWFRSSQVPLLAVWGRNDPIFVKEGAEAFKGDLKGAEVKLIDAGHFALETNLEEVAEVVGEFLGRYVK